MKTVKISLSDVINGPDAVAGSIFNFLKVIGTIQPIKEAMVIPITNVQPIIPLITNGATVIPWIVRLADLKNMINKPTTKQAIDPAITPFKKPMRTSLPTILQICFPSSSVSDRPRIVTARLCVPELPDISKMSDWNAATSGNKPMRFSKPEIILETKRSKHKRIKGLRTRLLTSFK